MSRKYNRRSKRIIDKHNREHLVQYSEVPEQLKNIAKDVELESLNRHKNNPRVIPDIQFKRLLNSVQCGKCEKRMKYTLLYYHNKRCK